MKKINPLKLTLVLIPIAVALTFIVRYLVAVILGNALHPAFTLVIYVVIFAILKMVSEKVLRQAIADMKAMDGGKYAWFLSEGN